MESRLVQFRVHGGKGVPGNGVLASLLLYSYKMPARLKKKKSLFAYEVKSFLVHLELGCVQWIFSLLLPFIIC